MMQTTTISSSIPGRAARKCLLAAAATGVVLAAVVAPRLTWPALLIAGLYLLGIMLGSTFFLALQNLCQARWSRSFEFVPRLLSGLLPWALVILIPVLTLGLPTLYKWSHTDSGQHPGHGAAHGFKAMWLSPVFFWSRAAVYLVVWVLFARAFARQRSSASRRPTRLAAAFMVIFAVTCVASSFDWIMSIDEHWFSTIFGVYNFAGMFVSTLAAITLILIVRGKAQHSAVRPDQLHDLGRLLFGFSCFWAYLWFSQYMLIWYSNLPEETGYYALRHSGIWRPISFLNVVCNWGVPFVALLSGSAKRNPETMFAVCIVLLIGRAVDLTFMVLPPFAGESIAGLAFSICVSAAAVVLPVAMLWRATSGPGRTDATELTS